MTVTTSPIGGTGDVDGPGTSVDNTLTRFEGTTGKLVQTSSAVLSDADALSGLTQLDVDNVCINGNTVSTTTGALTLTPTAGSVLNLDNANATVDDGVVAVTGSVTVDNLVIDGNTLSSTSGDVNITPLTGEDVVMTVAPNNDVIVNGSIDINHTATFTDDHALQIDVDADTFGDVRAVDINYDAGSIAAGDDEAAILISFNEAQTTGGTVTALEVLTTNEGTASVYGMQTFVNVNPVLQSAGTFGNMDSALNIAVDVLAALSSGGAGNITMFAADNDTVTIGDAAKFEEMEIIIGTAASGGGVAPTFEYSDGVGSWVTFTPTDGSNGFRNSGAIAWLVGDLATWAVGTGVEYLIRITRTRNTLATSPIVDEVQIAATTEYKWDSAGDLNVGSVDIDASNAYSVAGTAILSDAAGTMTLSNVDAFDATTAATASAVNFAADAEASDTYVIALSPALGAYVVGKEISFTANTANTGACTINVNGLGAISLKKLHDQDPANGDIESGSVVNAVYDGTNFQITSQIATTPGGGTVTSVTGTANEVDSTGGATPVLSLSATAVAPGTLGITTITASRAVATDGANLLVSSATTSTELGYVNGVTSALQTQLDAITGQDAGKNYLINGDFQVDQRLSTGLNATAYTAASYITNGDDTHLLDKWCWLSDGADVADVSQDLADTPDRGGAACKVLIATANKKFGLLNIIEYKDTIKLAGGVASLSFSAKKDAGAATLSTLRAAIISWDSTADAVTSDVVSAWSIAGTDPVLVANWTYENAPSDLTLTTAYQTFSIENVSIDTASTKNVAVFIWCDDTDCTAADIAHISNVKLNIGATATTFYSPVFAEEYLLCQRYFFKNIPYAAAVGTAASGSAAYTVTSASIAVAAYYVDVAFAVPMRLAPTVVTYPYTTTTNTSRWSNNGGTDYAASSAVIASKTNLVASVRNDSVGALTVATNIVLGGLYAHSDL